MNKDLESVINKFIKAKEVRSMCHPHIVRFDRDEETAILAALTQKQDVGETSEDVIKGLESIIYCEYEPCETLECLLERYIILPKPPEPDNSVGGEG